MSKVKKAKNECLYCGSRFCYNRIVSQNMAYDEVSCYKHTQYMEYHSDLFAPKIRKKFITSSAIQKRDAPF